MIRINCEYTLKKLECLKDLPSLLIVSSTHRPLFYPTFLSIDVTLAVWGALQDQTTQSTAMFDKNLPLGACEYLIPSMPIHKNPHS